jgi:hypothetical protein
MERLARAKASGKSQSQLAKRFSQQKSKPAARKAGRESAAQVKQFIKDWVFDPTNPADYAMALIPGAKPAATGLKAASKLAAIARKNSNAAKSNKMSVEDLSKMASREFGTAGNVSPNYWVNKGLMSQKDMDLLRADIAANGIRTPLQLDNVRGKDVLVDGHHRLAIARMLGLKDLPIVR